MSKDNKVDFLDTIVLFDEEENEVEFEVITKLDIEDQEFVIVTRAGSDDEEAIALKIVEEDGEYFFHPVEDEAEYEMVSEAYATLMDEDLV